MYEKHGAFYLVNKEGKWVRLGSEYHEAIVKYSTLVKPAIGRVRLDKVMDAYISEKIPPLAERTQADYLDSIKLLRPVFGGMWPEDVEPKHIYQDRKSTRLNSSHT